MRTDQVLFKQFHELTDSETTVLTRLMFEFEACNTNFLKTQYRLRYPDPELSIENISKYINMLRTETPNPKIIEGISLILSDEGFIVGYIWWKSSVEIENAIDIDQIYVTSLYRRCGYALRSLKVTMEYITRVSNITKFCLEAYTKNTAALKLYEKAGFDKPLKTILYKE